MLEDRDARRVGRLVRTSEAEVDVAIEGVVHGYRCYRAPQLGNAMATGTPFCESEPTVTVVDKWHVMLLPMGPKGSPSPPEITFHESAFKLDGGSAVAVLAPE